MTERLTNDRCESSTFSWPVGRNSDGMSRRSVGDFPSPHPGCDLCRSVQIGRPLFRFPPNASQVPQPFVSLIGSAFDNGQSWLFYFSASNLFILFYKHVSESVSIGNKSTNSMASCFMYPYFLLLSPKF